MADALQCIVKARLKWYISISNLAKYTKDNTLHVRLEVLTYLVSR